MNEAFCVQIALMVRSSALLPGRMHRRRAGVHQVRCRWKRYANIVNEDGIDPDSCADVCIYGCTIASRDDCIAIKSGRDEEGRRVGVPSERIRVRSSYAGLRKAPLRA